MKKKAYVTLVLLFIVSAFFVSSLFAFDSLVVPTSGKDASYFGKLQSFFEELAKSLFVNPEGSKDDIISKYDESEVDRRGHRIRIPASEGSGKKFIKINK